MQKPRSFPSVKVHRHLQNRKTFYAQVGKEFNGVEKNHCKKMEAKKEWLEMPNKSFPTNKTFFFFFTCCLCLCSVFASIQDNAAAVFVEIPSPF